jgi:hypothetical protein
LRYTDVTVVLTKKAKDTALDLAVKYILEREELEKALQFAAADKEAHDSLLMEGAVAVFFQSITAFTIIELWRNTASGIIELQKSNAPGKQEEVKISEDLFVQENEQLRNELAELRAKLGATQDELSAAQKNAEMQKSKAVAAQRECSQHKKIAEDADESVKGKDGEIKELQRIIYDIEEFAEKNSEDDVDDIDYHEKLLELSHRYRIIVIGGNDNLISKISVTQPNIVFLGNQNGKRVDDACTAADIVFVKYDCMSHAIYWKAKSICENAGVPFRYICPNTSIPTIERDIVSKIFEEFSYEK